MSAIDGASTCTRLVYKNAQVATSWTLHPTDTYYTSIQIVQFDVTHSTTYPKPPATTIKMRFTYIATALFAAGAANAQVDSIISQITSVAGSLPSDAASAANSLASQLTSGVGAIPSNAASIASSITSGAGSLPSDVASRINSIASSADAAGSSIRSEVESAARSVTSRVGSAASSATSSAGAASTGAAQPTALPAMGAVAGGLFALAGLL